MTVKELMELLRDEDPDMDVVATCRFGDRCNTQQAVFFEGGEVKNLKNSAYSDSGWAVVDLDGDEGREVLALS